MNDSDPPKLKLRWYQFSLRTPLIVVLVLTVGHNLLMIYPGLYFRG
ncbi:MAG: hypothetical protein HQ567_14135 [Candidatus Nealsonbacteria bacterium]|nr:hypothetical protein [Candidatus Nealsonbacteria bacterium]